MTVTYVQSTDIKQRILDLATYFQTLYWSGEVSTPELKKVEMEIQQLKSLIQEQ